MPTIADALLFWAGKEGYLPVDSDATSPNYYGFQNKEGEWYIMKETITGSTTTYRYAKGGSGYAGNWTLRADLTYALVSVTFA
ncbi:MAG: hypothetical protein Q8R78_03285 [Candidatus Omnitrophota bacterium]|nr:hypothetical protein [Candidatus Omnitrophota bacterium]